MVFVRFLECLMSGSALPENIFLYFLPNRWWFNKIETCFWKYKIFLMHINYDVSTTNKKINVVKKMNFVKKNKVRQKNFLFSKKIIWSKQINIVRNKSWKLKIIFYSYKLMLNLNCLIDITNGDNVVIFKFQNSKIDLHNLVNQWKISVFLSNQEFCA